MSGESGHPSAAAKNLEYYDTLAAGRDEYWRKMAAPRHRLWTFLRLIKEHRPARIVDLGCGNGMLLSELRRHRAGAKLCGIDLSAAQIEENRGHFLDVRFEVAYLDQPSSIPEELRGHFDAVIASEIIEHVDQPETLLRNAWELAAPGAFLFLSTQSGPVRETERRVGHRRHFAADEVHALMTGAGFEPLRIWNCGFPFHDLSKWAANLDPESAMERFGERRYGLLQNIVCAALRAAFLLNSETRGAQLFGVARRSAAPA